MNRIIITLTLLVLTAACAEDSKETALIGTWQAIQLIEEDSLLEMNVDEVKLSFDEHGSYTFKSTLDHMEAGKYRYLNNLIYLKDTTQKNKEEIAVRLLTLSVDSLAIEMDESGKKRVLSLQKTE